MYSRARNRKPYTLKYPTCNQLYLINPKTQKYRLTPLFFSLAADPPPVDWETCSRYKRLVTSGTRHFNDTHPAASAQLG